MKTLGGSLMVCDGKKYDYCFVEAIQSLLGFCDDVVVTTFSKEDADEIQDRIPTTPRLRLWQLDRHRWDETHGRERLNLWTNFTKECLSTEWHFNLQADEIVHENCYQTIRMAIEKPVDGFLCRRFNLWGDPYHYLRVDHSRLPCSDYVIRLAKTRYKSCGDAESLEVQATDMYKDAIRIYHMGFVRDRAVMPKKVLQMQQNVFEIEPDKRIVHQEVFDPWSVDFKPQDVVPLLEPLPKVIQEWSAQRAYGAKP